MYFCANPRCLFHIDVEEDILSHTVVLPELGKPLHKRPFSHVTTLTRKKQLWINPKKNIKWYFCESCSEVAKMIIENVGE